MSMLLIVNQRFNGQMVHTWMSFQFISETDIRNVLKNLTQNELNLDEQQKITEKIIEEGDIDNGQ